MADGQVIIVADVDDKKAKAKLNALGQKVQDLETQLARQKSQRLPLAEQAQLLGNQLDEAKGKLYEMQNAAEGTFTSDAIEHQAENVKLLEAQWNKATQDVNRYDRSIASLENRIDETKEKAGKMAAELARPSARLKAMADDAGASFEKLGKRILGLVKRVFVFSLITKALRGIKNWMMETIKTNNEAAAAIGNLKGALLTLAQPIVQVIIPAFIALVNVLTKVVAAIAAVISKLFGSTLSQSAEAAKGLNAEKEALNGVGGAAKDAAKSMAAFDEINQLDTNQDAGGGGGGGTTDLTAPNFDLGFTEEQLDTIMTLVEGIGAGLLAWGISQAFHATLKQGIGIGVAIMGIVVFLNGYFDAWANGVTGKNLIKMVAGLTAAAIGLGIAFGPVAAGIVLIVGGVAMLVLGIKDVLENGLNLKNGLLVIAGIIATGLGIALLTGSIIPALIAAILAIVLALTTVGGTADQVIGGIKDILNGIVTFIKGVFKGDWDAAWEGLTQVFTGIGNVILGMVGGVINALIKGMNWLIGKLNTISFDVPDWVPGIGGKTLGVNIPTINEWQVPQLAQGAVIPPNSEFLAVLGDQKKGTNIEAPLDTIVQAFRQAMSEQGNGRTIVLQLDKRELGRAVVDVSALESQRLGLKLGGA